MKLLRYLRFLLALWAGKFFLFLYCHTGHVRNDKPGMASMRLCGDFLKYVAKPKLTIVVTGTNGKTTISSMAASLLTAQGMTVSYNDWGANHHAGVARCLLNAVNIFNRPTKDAAVIEMDELISPLDVPHLHPNYIIVSNLARDSMLRNAHPEYIFDCLDRAISDTPGAVVILNGDDPISSFLGKDHRCIYFGIANWSQVPMPSTANDFPVCPVCGTKPVYVYRNYRHMGEFYCPTCGLKSKPRDYMVTAIDRASGTFTLQEPGGAVQYPLISNSMHNLANLSAVVPMFRDMGVSPQALAVSLSQVHIPASRESHETAGGIELITYVAKGQNATAVSTVLEHVVKDPSQKEVILLLDEVFDSPLKTETIAWIYDTDFELLCDSRIQKIVLGGARYLDHRLRLLLAGIPEEKLVCLRNEYDTARYVDTQGIEKIFILHDVNAITRGRQIRDAVRQRILEERGTVGHDH